MWPRRNEVRLRFTDEKDLTEKLSAGFRVPRRALDSEMHQAILTFLKAGGATISEERPLLGLLIGGPEWYVLNVKKTVWTLLGFVLDVFITQGGASATLAALGIIGQCVGKLDAEHGEVCIYRDLLAATTPKTLEDIHASLTRSCQFNSIPCGYKVMFGCSITPGQLKDRLDNLRSIGAVTQLPDGKWKTEL